MIEKHVCYYRVNDTALYRSIISEEGFRNDMHDIGLLKEEIIELENEEFCGIFLLDPKTYSNKAFKYFEDKGIFFIMTRPSEVSPVQAQKEMLQELDSIKSRLKHVA